MFNLNVCSWLGRACLAVARIMLQTHKIIYEEVHGALGRMEIGAVSGNSVLIWISK